MFGTYDESAKIVERLIKLYLALPLDQKDRDTAINALMTARAAILHEEEEAIKRCEHYFEGERFPKDRSEFEDLPYDIRHIDMLLKSQEQYGGN